MIPEKWRPACCRDQTPLTKPILDHIKEAKEAAEAGVS